MCVYTNSLEIAVHCDDLTAKALLNHCSYKARFTWFAF